MYYINKIVGWCTSPLGVLFVGIIVGAILAHFGTRRSRRSWVIAGRSLIVAVLVFFWFISCGFTIRWIGLPLEGEEIDPVVTLSNERIDAIVLLGGGVGHHEKCLRPELHQGADRVWMAARLWKALENKPLLTVSGGAAKGEVPMLKEMGVDVSRVLMLEAARNTEEEARMIKQAIGSDSAPRIALVTSAWHMPRAKWLFERAGLEVLPAPTDYEVHCAVERQYNFSDFFPHIEALDLNSYCIKEWVARICYSLKSMVR